MEAYEKARDQRKDPALTGALLGLAQTMLEKAYVNKTIEPVLIGVDWSSSMQPSIELGTAIAGMLAYKLDKVDMAFFGNEFMVVPKNKIPKSIQDIIRLKNESPARGYTNISDIISYGKKIKPRTLILISDGGENSPSWTEGHTLENVGKISPPPRVLYLYVPEHTYNFPEKIEDYLKRHEYEYYRTEVENLGQIDRIIPLLSYTGNTELEADISRVGSAFLAPYRMIKEKVCPICDQPLTDPIKLACGHQFHQDCIKRYWDVVGEKRCVFGCKPASLCSQCGAPAPADSKKCVYCEVDYTF
jgi:hypothetical protein